MRTKARAHVFAISVAFVSLSVLSGCYRDREARNEHREEKREKKEIKYEEHHER